MVLPVTEHLYKKGMYRRTYEREHEKKRKINRLVETGCSHRYYRNPLHCDECVWFRGKNRGATTLDTIIRFLGTDRVLRNLPLSGNCDNPWDDLRGYRWCTFWFSNWSYSD